MVAESNSYDAEGTKSESFYFKKMNRYDNTQPSKPIKCWSWHNQKVEIEQKEILADCKPQEEKDQSLDNDFTLQSSI